MHLHTLLIDVIACRIIIILVIINYKPLCAGKLHFCLFVCLHSMLCFVLGVRCVVLMFAIVGVGAIRRCNLEQNKCCAMLYVCVDVACA